MALLLGSPNPLPGRVESSLERAIPQADLREGLAARKQYVVDGGTGLIYAAGEVADLDAPRPGGGSAIPCGSSRSRPNSQDLFD